MKFIFIAVLTALVVGTAPKQTVVDEPAPPIVHAEKQTTKQENIKKSKVTWKDNPKNCNQETHWIAKEKPHKCIKKHTEIKRVQTSHKPGVEQWRSLVSKYNWDADLVLRIMSCESGGNPNSVNSTPPDYSVGLMQINLYGSLALTRPSEAWLKVPANNIEYAYGMSNGGTDFSPWTCYYKV